MATVVCNSDVLLVSSNPGMRAAVAVALRVHWHVRVARSLSELDHQLRATIPALILLDLDVDNAEAVRSVESIVPHASATRCVLVQRPVSFASLFHEVRCVLAAHDGAPRLSPLSAEVIEYVATHYEKASIRDIAAALRISARHLHRRFRSETTMPPKKFLDRVRIEAAKDVMGRWRNEKLQVIATSVGFYDASHLARTLRRNGEPSPAFYRRTHSDRCN